MDIHTLDHLSEPVHVAVLPNGFTFIHIEHKSELVFAEFIVAAGSADDMIYGWLRNDFHTESLEEYLDFVDSVTPADLLEAHHAYWDPNRLLIIRSDPT